MAEQQHMPPIIDDPPNILDDTAFKFSGKSDEGWIMDIYDPDPGPKTTPPRVVSRHKIRFLQHPPSLREGERALVLKKYGFQVIMGVMSPTTNLLLGLYKRTDPHQCLAWNTNFDLSLTDTGNEKPSFPRLIEGCFHLEGALHLPKVYEGNCGHPDFPPFAILKTHKKVTFTDNYGRFGLVVLTKNREKMLGNERVPLMFFQRYGCGVNNHRPEMRRCWRWKVPDFCTEPPALKAHFGGPSVPLKENGVELDGTALAEVLIKMVPRCILNPSLLIEGRGGARASKRDAAPEPAPARVLRPRSK